MNYYEAALLLHEKNKGKIEMVPKVRLDNKDDLSTVYTPGVAQPCIEIKNNPENVYKYTPKGNTVAVISDGSAVLGLGNIGAKAAIPVMEGKAVLFKAFGGIDAVPICLETRDVDEIVHIIKNISPVFGGINLEDISAPRCFEIEERLIKELDIPVFHDDQHGTAIVVSAAVINAYRLLNRPLTEIKAVLCGAGAAGNAIVKMLKAIGIADIVVCDSKGIISSHREAELGIDKKQLLGLTNPEDIQGGLAQAVEGRDLFIGVSGPKVLTVEMAKTMNKDSVIFAMSNPEPEILPREAKAAGAAIVGTGRSDYPNQINNVLVFPGIFKGALSARAKSITGEMKLAAAYALANTIGQDELCADYIIPDVFNKAVANAVAGAVADATKKPPY